MVKNVILIFILGLFPSIKEYIKVLEKIYVNQRAYVDLNQQGKQAYGLNLTDDVKKLTKELP
jgi:N-acetylneuraminic acid mutarotase